MWRILATVIVSTLIAVKVAVSGPALDRFRAAMRVEGMTLAGAAHCALGHLSPADRRACKRLARPLPADTEPSASALTWSRQAAKRS